MREYYDIRANKRVVEKYESFIDALHKGFKSVNGKLNMLTDVNNYMLSLCEHGGNPHTWDKLLRRARAHNCSSQLRALKATFIYERDHTKGYPY